MRIHSRSIRAVLVLTLATSSWAAPQAPPTLAEEFKLTSSDAESGDELGYAVSLHGDTALVGVPYDDDACPADPTCNSGSAYVFAFDGTAWIQQAKLTPSDTTQRDEFGFAVSLYGDTAVIGNHDGASAGTTGGTVYVFVRTGSSWNEQAVLHASNASLGDTFGFAVAVHGDTLVAGAPWDSLSTGVFAGSAHVFTRSGTVWSEQAVLTAFDNKSGDHFGSSVALMGDMLVIGSPDDDHAGGTDAGSAYVFDRAATTWSYAQKLSASDAEGHDHFGEAVALSAEVLVAGCPHDDKPGASSVGSAYVFERDGSDWVEETRLTASDGAQNDLFGQSVAVSECYVVAGVYSDGHLAGGTGGSQGSAHAFRRVTPGTFTAETKLYASDGNAAGRFGYSVSAYGDRAFVGSPWKHETTVPLSSSGAAYVHDLTVLLAPTSYCTAGISASGCQAALSGSGKPSASVVSGFTVAATGVEGSKEGLFFYGTGGRQANPWGNGTSLNCVVPPVKRGGLLPASGTIAQCNGSFAQDLNARWCAACPKPAHNPGAGAVVQVQLWYRDPWSSSNQTISLSDALEFVVGP
jgi:hypothetical protein